MGDYYRYAYEATLIDRYVEPEVVEDPASPKSMKKKSTFSLASSVEGTNDEIQRSESKT